MEGNGMMLLEGELECRAKGHPSTKGTGWCDCGLLGSMPLSAYAGRAELIGLMASSGRIPEELIEAIGTDGGE